MPPTTIKVDTDVRDRLAALAGARGQSMGAYLDEVTRRLATEARVTAIQASYARLAEDDPVAWQSYLEELSAWDSVMVSADAEANAEWPEYNGSAPTQHAVP